VQGTVLSTGIEGGGPIYVTTSNMQFTMFNDMVVFSQSSEGPHIYRDFTKTDTYVLRVPDIRGMGVAYSVSCVHMPNMSDHHSMERVVSIGDDLLLREESGELDTAVRRFCRLSRSH